MKKWLSILFVLGALVQTVALAQPYQPKAQEYVTLQWDLRHYSDYLSKMDWFFASPSITRTNYYRLTDMREGIARQFLTKDPHSGDYGFSDKKKAFAYIYNSSLENTFYPGADRDPSLTLEQDYARHLAFIKVVHYLGDRGPRLSATPNLGDIQNYYRLCGGTNALGCMQTYCNFPKPIEQENCRQAIQDFGSLPIAIPQSREVQPIYWPSNGGSCLTTGAEANLKISFIIEALMKRGRIIPVSPATRKKLAATHHRGKQWLEKTEEPGQGSVSLKVKSRLLTDVPDYRLLGLYDCTPDGQGSGKIYVDATLNPYDLATFVLHELNHFAADKFASPQQVNILKQLDANQISFLEDIGSFAISALSQIDITSHHEAERRRRSNAWTLLAPFPSGAQGPLTTLTGAINSLRDYGDLSRFSRKVSTGGAISAYLLAEKTIQDSIAASRAAGEEPKYENPICEVTNKILPNAWMQQMTQRPADSEAGDSAGPATQPADTNRLASRAQNIFHQIADGCYRDINVMDLRDEIRGKLLQFNYTPIIDALKRRWIQKLTDAHQIEQLRRHIDLDIGSALSRVSRSCKHMMARGGVDGVKSAVEGGQLGVDGSKSKPGVDGTKSKPAVDHPKSKPALDQKSRPGKELKSFPGIDGVKS